MLESLYIVKVFVILDVIIPNKIQNLVFPSEEPYKIIKVGQCVYGILVMANRWVSNDDRRIGM